MKNLNEIKARLEKATPGPWETGIEFRIAGVNDGSNPYWHPRHVEEGKCHWCDTYELLGTIESSMGNQHVHADLSDRESVVNRKLLKTVISDFENLSKEDADFIAHAPEDVSQLIARVEKLEKALERIVEAGRDVDKCFGRIAREALAEV